MNALRVIVICLLTAAVLLAICAPALLSGALPEEVISAASMEEFPLLGTCSRIARDLVAALRGGQAVSAELVTDALGDGFLDELLSLLMVSALTIPVSFLLGVVLYKPLYKGALSKGLLYVSLNLCSVMLAWVLYRKVYFRLLIEDLIQKNITDQTLQTVVNYLTQLFSVAALGLVAVRVILALAAARAALRHVILPLVGTLVRTLLFAFLVALILLLQAEPAAWGVILPLMAASMLASAVSDAVFGC